MPTITVQYASLEWAGGHTRQPRTISNAGFTPIPGAPSGPVPIGLGPGELFYVNPPQTPPTWDGVTYTFAFTSVSDGTSVGLVSTDPNPNPPLQFTVGANPVTILYVYIAPGGGGNGSGANIDAFNETTGSLVDNDFVLQVTPDPTGALAEESNVEGWVNTTNSGYTIEAYHPNIGPYLTLPTSALFVNWVIFYQSLSGAIITAANLYVPVGDTVYALAIYYNPKAKESYDKPPRSEKAHHLIDKIPDTKNEMLDKIAQDNYKEATLREKSTDKPYTNEFAPHAGGPIQAGGSGSSEAFVRHLQNLTQKVSELEAKLSNAAKGKAFIKESDRPAVGKARAKKPDKSR
jgi:hypothetical protein